MDFGRPVSPDKVEIDAATGEVRFWKDGVQLQPESAELRVTYPRDKGPKVINSAIFKDETTSLSLPASLWRFDRLFAIDTNSKEAPSGRISIAAVLEGFVKRFDRNRSLMSAALTRLFEFRDVASSVNPERIAWSTLLQDLEREGAIGLNSRVGLIVDSELGLVQQFNAGTLPIHDQQFLPPGVELLYASSDTGGQYILNQWIARCHDLATHLLDAVAADKVPDDHLIQAVDQPFARIRRWMRTADHTVGHIVPVDPTAGV